MVRNIVKQGKKICAITSMFKGSKTHSGIDQVNAVRSIIEEMGNPLADQTGDLFVLDARDIADSQVVETVRTVQQLGQDQYQQFVTKS